MSKHVTSDGKHIEFEGNTVAIPEGWIVVPHTDSEYRIKDSDMTFRKGGSFKMSMSSGQRVADKICVIREMTKAEKEELKAKIEVKEKPVQRLNQEDFLKSINGL